MDLSTDAWTAGGVFSRVVAESLDAVTDSSHLRLVTSGEAKGLPRLQRVKPYWKYQGLRERVTRKLLRNPRPGALPLTADSAEIDVLLPILFLTSASDLLPRGKAATVGWIPDFQHEFLPELFDPRELTKRRDDCRRCAEVNDLVLLSSESVAADFRQFLPDFATKARVAPFPSSFAFDPPPESHVFVRRKYDLPEKFLLVANQFWAHKNHACVVQALDILRRQGTDATVVFIGQLSDGRSHHCPASAILQQIAELSLRDHVRVLGRVPREDLLALLREAAAIIQPSKFEGWSTTVQDAKALGRPVICSDIATHREQAPQALGFFPVDGPQELAAILSQTWQDLSPGPHPADEARALTAERDFALAYGRTLHGICAEAVALRK
jgi:glycosyltransferase involved in cell wall biosynthesis